MTPWSRTPDTGHRALTPAAEDDASPPLHMWTHLEASGRWRWSVGVGHYGEEAHRIVVASGRPRRTREAAEAAAEEGLDAWLRWGLRAMGRMRGRDNRRTP